MSALSESESEGNYTFKWGTVESLRSVNMLHARDSLQEEAESSLSAGTFHLCCFFKIQQQDCKPVNVWQHFKEFLVNVI